MLRQVACGATIHAGHQRLPKCIQSLSVNLGQHSHFIHAFCCLYTYRHHTLSTSLCLYKYRSLTLYTHVVTAMIGSLYTGIHYSSTHLKTESVYMQALSVNKWKLPVNKWTVPVYHQVCIQAGCMWYPYT